MSYYTSKELAEYLRVSEQTLRKWRSEKTHPLLVANTLPGSNRIRYSHEVVHRWLEECRCGGVHPKILSAQDGDTARDRKTGIIYQRIDGKWLPVAERLAGLIT